MEPGRELVVLVKRIAVYQCERCQRAFADPLGLEKHSAYHDELFHAHICSAQVVLHKAIFHGCQECAQCFLTRREYVLHKVKHIQNTVKIARTSGNNGMIFKPYQCPDCDYCFAAASTLEAHSVIHQPFPHVCECGIGYYTKKDLGSHFKVVHENSSKHPIILPWTPKIEFAAIQENKPNIAMNAKARGPKLRADLLFKSATTRKPNTKRKIIVELKQKNKPTQSSTNPNIYIEMTSDRKYLCPVCKKKLSSKTGVYTHYRTHTGERPYQCKICEKYFTQVAALNLHLARHTGIRNHSCPNCPKKFYQAADLRLHMRTHTGYKPFECTFCGKPFGDPSAFARHERTHTGDKRYICPYCPMRFSDASGLIMHRKRHENKKNFSCDTCGKLFYDRSSMLKHTVVHDQIRKKPFCCDYCSKCFSNKSYLVTHIQNTHLQMKNYKCNYCSKAYLFSCVLEKHMQVNHKVARKHRCDYCSKLYCLEISLKRHYMMAHKHVTKRYYECDECSATCDDKAGITRHILKEHINISCDKCLQYFPSHSALENHEFDEGEACGICDKVFYCKGLMKQHLEVHIMLKKDCQT